MQKVIVIRHSDEDNQNSKYVANLQKNKDGSYSASVGVVKEDGYDDYVSKHCGVLDVVFDDTTVLYC